MPRIKKSEVQKTELPEPSKVRDESIKVKRIHRKSPVLTINPIVIPNEPNILYDETAPIVKRKIEVEDTTPRKEEIIVNTSTQEYNQIEPVEVEVTHQDNKSYDEFVNRFAADFMNEKPVIEKVESDVKTSEEKIAESDKCECNNLADLDFVFTPFMIKVLNCIIFVFASTFIIGFNILVLTFFAYLMACMFH